MRETWTHEGTGLWRAGVRGGAGGTVPGRYEEPKAGGVGCTGLTVSWTYKSCSSVPTAKNISPGCLDILMVQPLSSFSNVQLFQHLCSNVPQQSPLWPCTLKLHAPSWAILTTLSAILLFLALPIFTMLYHFIFYFVHCPTFYTRMGEAPMNGKQNVLMEEAQQILFYEYRRSGTESRMISRSQV